MRKYSFRDDYSEGAHPKELIVKLKEAYEFHIWKEIDAEYSAIRLITSWATDEQVVNDFIDYFRSLVK